MVYTVSFHCSELTDALVGDSKPSGTWFFIENVLLCEGVLSTTDTNQEVMLLNWTGSESSL